MNPRLTSLVHLQVYIDMDKAPNPTHRHGGTG
jgi:hypothetical protein